MAREEFRRKPVANTLRDTGNIPRLLKWAKNKHPAPDAREKGRPLSVLEKSEATEAKIVLGAFKCAKRVGGLPVPLDLDPLKIRASCTRMSIRDKSKSVSTRSERSDGEGASTEESGFRFDRNRGT